MNLNFRYYHEVLNSTVYAYSVDPKHPHIYGMGRNENEALRSLKIRYYQVKINDMANTCCTYITLTGKNKKLREFYNRYNSGKDEEIKEAKKIERIYTDKLDLSEDISTILENDEEGYINFTLESAWTEPFEFIETLAKDFVVDAWFDEPGSNYFGQITNEEGFIERIFHDSEYSWLEAQGEPFTYIAERFIENEHSLEDLEEVSKELREYIERSLKETSN